MRSRCPHARSSVCRWGRACFKLLVPCPGPAFRSGNEGQSSRRRIMSKAVILSAVLAIIILPVRAAKAKDPKEGLKKAIWYMVAFNLFYLFAIRYVVHI